MTQQGIITKLGLRLCDWVGNTVAEPLPHPHQSVWTIHAVQQGASGSSAIGDFTIPLFPPRSKEFALYKGIYDLVKNSYGLRIEAYILGEDGEYMYGIPVFSGIITKIDFELDKFELHGFDSLWLAQTSVFYPGQSFTGTGNAIFEAYNDVENLYLYDDFAGNQYLGTDPFVSGFSTPFTWAPIIGSVWTATVDDGLPGLSHGGAGENIIATQILTDAAILDNMILSNADSLVFTAWFHISNPSTVNGQEVSAEIVFQSDGGGQNLFMARARLLGNGTTYDIFAEIWKRINGTFTLLKQTSVFTGLTGDRRIQLQVIVINKNNPIGIFCVAIVNGKDSNCIADISGIQTWNGGKGGVRLSQSASATVFFTRFYVKTRVQSPSGQWSPPPLPFTDTGTFATARGINISLPSLSALSMLDLWFIAATFENWVFRKDAVRFNSVWSPGAGFQDMGDPIFWGIQGQQGSQSGPGFDLTSSIILDESTNIISGGASANAESIGTELKLGFGVSTDGAGQITWPDSFGILNLGRVAGNPFSPPLVINDIVQTTSVTDFLAARRIAEASGANKALTGQAKVFTILRTSDIATPRYDIPVGVDTDFQGKPFRALAPQAFRELDFLQLNVPSLGINKVKASVLAYTFRESDPTMDITLDQYPISKKSIIDRRRWGVLDTHLLKLGS